MKDLILNMNLEALLSYTNSIYILSGITLVGGFFIHKNYEGFLGYLTLAGAIAWLPAFIMPAIYTSTINKELVSHKVVFSHESNIELYKKQESKDTQLSNGATVTTTTKKQELVGTLNCLSTIKDCIKGL